MRRTGDHSPRARLMRFSPAAPREESVTAGRNEFRSSMRGLRTADDHHPPGRAFRSRGGTMLRSRGIATILMTALLLGAVATRSHAIPAFARKYRVTCSVCHTTVPSLNDFGERFASNGFEFMPGETPQDTIATGDELLRLLERINFAFRVDSYVNSRSARRAGGPSVDMQFPYGIKLLTGGPIANRVSYYMYFFMSERGEVAGLEDAYLQFTDIGGSGVSVMVGQFQASDPLMKRELRLEYEDYQPYRVRVGEVNTDL